MKSQPFFYCEQCDTTVLPEVTRVETLPQTFTVRGEEITVEMPARLCRRCGTLLNDSALDSAMMIALYDTYRGRHNIIFPAQIVALREKYGLSQRNLALLLGLGEATVHRYETGALAEAAPSKLLRLMENPVNMQKMLAESGAKLSEFARAKAQSRVDALLSAPVIAPAPKPRAKRAAKVASALSAVDTRLAALGFKPKEVGALKRLVLPPHFADATDLNAAQCEAAETSFAATLGLEMASLRDPQASLRFGAQAGHFKSYSNAPPARESLVCALGHRLGQLVATAFDGEIAQAAPRAAASIRAEILATGAPWIGLRELLEWSWSHGLPVVKATLPDGLKRWDGMALCPRPLQQSVAISFCAHCRPSWQAFIVAHELGHHFLEHVTPDRAELDEDSKAADEAHGDGDGDGERKVREIAANDFARELLTGNRLDSVPLVNWQWDKAPILAQKIGAYAIHHKIHPGVVAFQLFQQVPQRKALCMKAAELCDPEDAALIFAPFHARLDTSRWTDEEAALFLRFTAPQVDQPS